MSPLDLSHLSPADAAAALRSYVRRYRAELQPIRNDEDVEELAHRVGPGGRSCIQIVSDVTRTLVVLGEALRQITVTDTPILHPAVVDPSQRDWEMPAPESLDETLGLFADEANKLADMIDHVGTSSWTRSGEAAGGRSVTALEVVREAVGVGHDGLDEVTRTLQAVRS